MSVQQTIEQKLTGAFAPEHLQVINESHGHNVRPGSETHFKVVLVSAAMQGKRPVQRHQSVYAVLGEELQNGVHALALHLYSPEEWSKVKAAPDSPACMGGAKK